MLLGCRNYSLLCSILLTSNVYANVTFQQAKNVWAKLSNKSGYHVQLKYDDDMNSNAYSMANAVYITAGMLNDLDNDAQIAFVLGHELGHYIKGHYRREDSAKDELEADKIGYYFCRQMGYYDCVSFMYKMQKLYGNKGDEVHPDWNIRIRNIQK